MNQSIYKIGFWSGIVAFVATVSYVVVQLIQIAGVLHYPVDGILIYSTSLCIVIPFILLVLSLHYITPDNKKFWSHAALVFTILYAVFVIANYVVQLATVIPMSLKGAANEIRLLDQTPHSMFWDFDALGYIFMGVATLFAVPVFDKKLDKWVRRFFLANALVTPLIMFVYFYPNFSPILVLIGLPWAITAPGSMLLLAVRFRRQYNREKQTVKQQ